MAAMAVATYQVLCDWNDDDDYVDTGEDLTARVLNCEWSRGRDYASQLIGRSISGKARILLNNESGDYNSFNASSPLSGSIVPGHKVEIRRTPFFGHYLEFVNGDDDVVTVTDDAAIQDVFDGGGTIEAWIRPDTAGQSNIGRVVGKERWFIGLSSVNTLRVFYTFSGTSGDWFTRDAPLTAGKKLHVAVTIDADNAGETPLVYVDGVAVTMTVTAASVGTRTTDVGQNLYIGNRAALSNDFDGGIDEVRLWSDIRTPAEILANYNKELIGTEAGLVGYWRFNEGQGATVADATSNGNDGTITGASWKNTDILWRGRLQRIVSSPQVLSRNVALLEAVGPLGYLNEREVEIAMQSSVATGTLIGTILTNAGWSTTERNLATGLTTITRFWADQARFLSVARKVELSEAGFLWEQRDGFIAFDDRQARLAGDALVSQATFTDAGGGALAYSEIKQADPLPFIFNIFKATVRAFTVESLATLWTSPEGSSDSSSPALEVGESKTFEATYPNRSTSDRTAVAVNAWTTPVSTTDYTANTAANGGGTDRTSSVGISVEKLGHSMKITMTNNHATDVIYITKNEARGTAVTEDDPVMLRDEDSTSKTDYGEREFTSLAEFIPDSAEADDWCRHNLGIYKDPQPVLDLTMHGGR